MQGLQQFKFLSWNVANISQGEFEVLLHEFEEFCEWDVCALQELGPWSAGRHWYFANSMLAAGSLFSGSHPVGLFIKRHGYERFVCSIDHPRHFTTQFRTAQGRLFTCTSAHLPGCHNSTSDFEETLDSLRTVRDEKNSMVL